MSEDWLKVDYKPRFPDAYSPGIGIIGCGGIVKGSHLKAYNLHKLNVVGVYDRYPEATEGVQEKFGVKHIFGELDELLAHPEIEVVDIATHRVKPGIGLQQNQRAVSRVVQLLHQLEREVQVAHRRVGPCART